MNNTSSDGNQFDEYKSKADLILLPKAVLLLIQEKVMQVWLTASQAIAVCVCITNPMLVPWHSVESHARNEKSGALLHASI